MKNKIDYTGVLIIVILIVQLVLLVCYHAPIGLNESTEIFSNIATPLATIIAAVIYFYTLLEIKTQNKQHINSYQFQHLKSKIDTIKNDLTELNFNNLGKLVSDDLLKYQNIPMMITDYKLFNGLNYQPLYETLKSKVKGDEKYIEDLINNVSYEEISKRSYFNLAHKIQSNMLRPLHLHYEVVKDICAEILGSNLDKIHKSILLDLIADDILQSYFAICNNRSFSELNEAKGMKFLHKDILIKNQWWNNNTSEIRIDSILELSRFEKLFFFMEEKGINDFIKKERN